MTTNRIGKVDWNRPVPSSTPGGVRGEEAQASAYLDSVQPLSSQSEALGGCCVLTIADKNVRKKRTWLPIAKVELSGSKQLARNSLSVARHLPMLGRASLALRDAGEHNEPIQQPKRTVVKTMHYNRRTSALLAAGIISVGAIAHADEKVTAIQTALSSTTISGYVDTSAQWNFGTGNANNPPYAYGGAGKADGFNLNVVQLSLSKPLDESEWASGYKVDLWFGPDANTLGTHSAGANTSDFTIKQAYVALRTPVGNGIDWKIGVFDTIIGYESSESPNNPNFTRSYGYTIEPTTHTGLLGTYRVCEEFSFSAGVANTHGPAINQRAFPPAIAGVPGSGAAGNGAESYKTYMASVALTAPQSWGWAAGSTLYGGVINGFMAAPASFGNANGAAKLTSWYAGATLATPVTGLKCGVSFDYMDAHSGSTGAIGVGNDGYAVGVYGSYQATEKLSFHGRGELLTFQNNNAKDNFQIWEFTATAQYDLWQNVISRLEFRWDHGDEGKYFGGNAAANRNNAYMVAANVVYKF